MYQNYNIVTYIVCLGYICKYIEHVGNKCIPYGM